MKKWIPFLLLLSSTAMAAKIQQQGFKTYAECISAGASPSACLLLTAQVWDSVNSQQLSTSITNGNIGGIEVQGQSAIPGLAVLIPGSGVTMSQSGPNITINSTGGSGLIGAITWNPVASGDWNISGNTYQSFPANANFSFPAGSDLLGSALAPSTKIPAVKIASIPANSTIVLEGVGDFMNEGPTNIGCFFRFWDGSNLARGENTIASGGGINPSVPVIKGSFSYASPQTNVTFEVQAKNSDNSTTCAVRSTTSAANDNSTFTIYVYQYPL